MSTHNIKKYGLVAITQIIGFDKLRKRWQRLPKIRYVFVLSSLVVYFFKVPLQAPHSLYVICAESSGNSRDVCCLQFQSLFWVQVILLKYLYQNDIIACENFLTNFSSPGWQLDQSGQRWDISKFSNSKISLDMEVAQRYPLLKLLTVFTLSIYSNCFTLLKQ